MIVPFESEHAARLRPEDLKTAAQIVAPEQVYGALEGRAWSIVSAGEVVACGGFTSYWPGRALAWAIVGPEASKHVVEIVRAARRVIDKMPEHRIEAGIARGWEPGQKLAFALGFKPESIAEKWGPDGRDYEIWVRLR